MRWVQNSLFFTRTMSAGLAAATMVLAPVAHGAEAKKAAVANSKQALAANGNKAPAANTAKWIQNPVPKVDYNYNVDKEAVQKLFALTGLSKKKNLTVGEFFSKALPLFPKTLANDLGRWAMLNRNQLMPSVQVSTYKASEGKEQIRLVFSRDGQTMTMSFDPESDTKFAKVNNVDLSKKDFLFHDQAFRKIAKGDKSIREELLKKRTTLLAPNVKLSANEFNRLTPKEQVAYMINMRYLMNAAQNVQRAFNPKAKTAMSKDANDFFVQYVMGFDADAAGGPAPGGRCIVNGYLTVYDYTKRNGERVLSCGGGTKGRADLQKQIKEEAKRFNLPAPKCPSGSLPCAAVVYTFKSDGGRFCVKDTPPTITTATSVACENASPLQSKSGSVQEERENKERLIKSFMEHAKIDGKKDPLEGEVGIKEDGETVSKDMFGRINPYLTELELFVKTNTALCKTQMVDPTVEVLPDQKSACIALGNRIIKIKAEGVIPEPDTVVVDPPPQPPVVVDPCATPGLDPGEEYINEMGQPVKNGCQPEEPPYVAPVEEAKHRCVDDNKVDDGQGGCMVAAAAFGHGIGWKHVAAVGAGAALIYLLTRDKGKKKPAAPPTVMPPPVVVANPPYDPCPPAPLACTPTSPVVTPPPTVMPPPILEKVDPIPAPTVVVTPPPVVPPVVIPEPVPDIAEYTGNKAGSTADGVRKGR